MNYKKIYDSLIERGKSRILEEYTESHHIIPRCMGGDDSRDNLVDLTPEEHYLAHQLLVKIYPDNKRLAIAAAMMIPNRPSNKMYGWLKRKHSEAMSDAQTGVSNSQYGTRWIHNLEDKISKRINSSDELPDGWKEGRVIKFHSVQKTCTMCDEQHDRNSKFCSDKCKTYYKAPHYKIIDENLNEMIEVFKKCGSIDKTLRKFNIGLNNTRIGNKYLSDKLKENNIHVLRRRNTKTPD